MTGATRSGVKQSGEIGAEQPFDGIELGNRNIDRAEIHEVSVKWFRRRVCGAGVRSADRRVCHPEGMMAEAQIVVGVTTV